MRGILLQTAAFIAVRALFTVGELIPWLALLLRELQPIVAGFLCFFLGEAVGARAEELQPPARGLLVAYAVLAVLLLFLTPLIVGYYTLPVWLAQSIKREERVEVSYAEASQLAEAWYRQETGLSGIAGHSVYVMRRPLAAVGVREHIARQIERIGDSDSLPTALLNVVLHTIPVALKYLLTDSLGIVPEHAYIGLVFWYLVAVTVFFIGYRRNRQMI